MSVVLFRVDAGNGIGHGHLFRCLTLAKVLREYGLSSAFVCKAHPGHQQETVQASGFDCYLLPCASGAEVDPADYATWVGGPVDEDADATMDVATAAAGGDESVEAIVVDHYGLGRVWEQRFLRQGMKVWAIDDLANRRHVVSGLLDSGMGRTGADYAGLLQPGAVTLTGIDYTLLRPSFAALRSHCTERQSGDHPTLLIMFGGVDRQDWSARILSTLVDGWAGEALLVKVVLGSGYSGKPRLEKMAANAGFAVEIMQGIDDVAEVMASADLCVGGGGTAAWERCCLGLPTMMLQLAPNQAHNCRTLALAGAAICVPDPEREPPSAAAVLDLLADRERLAQIGSAAALLVDGYGARRVASHLLGIVDRDGQAVFLRPLSANDRDLIFAWQSQPGNRRYFRNPEVPAWEAHCDWFRAQLAGDAWNRIVVVAQRAVGLIRLTPHADGWEVSILIDRDCHGQRIGQAALQLLIREKADAILYAEIYSENAASVKLFENAGFHPLEARLYRRNAFTE